MLVTLYLPVARKKSEPFAICVHKHYSSHKQHVAMAAITISHSHFASPSLRVLLGFSFPRSNMSYRYVYRFQLQYICTYCMQIVDGIYEHFALCMNRAVPTFCVACFSWQMFAHRNIMLFKNEMCRHIVHIQHVNCIYINFLIFVPA